MSRLRAFFIGDSSLLIGCADLLVAAGHEVAGVATKDFRVRAWAAEQGHPLFEKDPSLGSAIAAIPFDYLFSIGNLDVTPLDVIERARLMAINFHDGPLPQYAGLNAPAWALLRNETQHGVTWHGMTATVDAGAIVAAVDVSIDPAETAFSLNTKCYEAGLKGFEEILAQLGADGLAPQPQVGARGYFGARRRPRAAGALDFSQSAEQVCALARALQFGPFANPLAIPKVLVGDRMALVGAAADVGGTAVGAPGDVLGVDADSITVATATTPVRLSALTCVGGQPLARAALDEIAAVGRVALVRPDLVDRVDALNAEAAGAEARWTDVSRRVQGPELPYPRLRGAAGAPAHAFTIKSAGDPDLDLAGLATWFLRITGGDTVSIAYRSAVHDGALGDTAPWFSNWRPLVVEPGGDAELAAVVAAAATARAELEARGPIACDLRARMAPGERPGVATEALPLAVAVGVDTPPPGGADLLLHLDPRGRGVRIELDGSAFGADVAAEIAAQIEAAIRAVAAARSGPVAALDLASEERRAGFRRFDRGPSDATPSMSVHESVSLQARKTPDAVAVETRSERLTYAELEARSTRAAARLSALGAGPGQVVGVCMERTADLVTALLAVMKTGAAYLPLDPAYPAQRIGLMLSDSRAPIVATSRRVAAKQGFGAAKPALIEDLAAEGPVMDWRPPLLGPKDLAYLIYTSGSTGRPKGVMVPHGAVANFFVGMDARIPHDPPGTWLAVTSPSFDISVLELFWALSRGFKVALHSSAMVKPQAKAPDFSLFYFSAEATSNDAYRLLLEGAKFADANGFEAVWTPERHFHDFGGAFPNPAVTGAAVAAVTSRVKIRAGSCVLPLHQPLRVAEEWAVVDAISGGRTGIAFASGWQKNDFVLAPQAFQDRKALMLSHIEQVRALWRGEAVAFPNPTGEMVETRTAPKAVQKDLPVWLTAAKSPETFEAAGRLGYNVLTHLLGMSPAELSTNIAAYRAAWDKAGHPGAGRVTLMLHTYVGDDDDSVREAVRAPMKRYLASAVDLVRDAAWSFPTFVDKAQQNGSTPAQVFEAEPLSAEELDALLDHAFERYYGGSGLFGSPETCLQTVAKVAAIGADEIACLIDFMPADLALAQLPKLKAVMDRAAGEVEAVELATVVDDLQRFDATHLQCTPSMASMVVEEARGRPAPAALRAVMVGGEALPLGLAQGLRQWAPDAALLNMYGPTETTIWSTVASLDTIGDFIPLGEPIANTVLRVAGPSGSEQPAFVPGELWIGGAGVTAGYWERPELTAERFVAVDGEVMYRTGDLVRRHVDGALEFLGRIDHQIKLRGHRIELGEIEAAIVTDEAVAQAVVVAREEESGDVRLVAYCVERPGAAFDEARLRAGLAERLPEIMTPSAFVVLPALPLTPNGKVDRAALPAPRQARAEAVVAGGEGLEEKIAAVWCELLGLDQVGVTQNFFDLGGHSLLAVQLQRRLRTQLGRETSIVDIFRYPTVRSLAANLGGKPRDANRVIDITRELTGPRRAAARRRVAQLAVRDDDL